MTPLVCLQGGAEFGPDCRGMDADLLHRAGGGPVVVAPLACRPGREYAAAGRHGVAHFGALGGAATLARDYRLDPQAALAEVAQARLLVLPGGAPSRIRDAVVDTPMGGAVRSLLDRGGVVMGASAGAMVLCERMWLPDRGGRIVPGLGVVPAVVVLPHYSGPPTPIEPPPGLDLLGLPECSGVLLTADGLHPVGARPSFRIGADGKERPV